MVDYCQNVAKLNHFTKKLIILFNLESSSTFLIYYLCGCLQCNSVCKQLLCVWESSQYLINKLIKLRVLLFFVKLIERWISDSSQNYIKFVRFNRTYGFDIFCLVYLLFFLKSLKSSRSCTCGWSGIGCHQIKTVFEELKAPSNIKFFKVESSDLQCWA